MSGFGDHAGFILAAYGASATILAVMIAAIILDGFRQRRQLADLEARGLRRRSARGASPASPARDEARP